MNIISGSSNTVIGDQSNIIVSNTVTLLVGENSFSHWSGLTSDLATLNGCELEYIIKCGNDMAAQYLHVLIIKSVRDKIKELDYFLNCSHNFQVYCDAGLGTEYKKECAMTRIFGHEFETSYIEYEYGKNAITRNFKYVEQGMLYHDFTCNPYLPDWTWLAFCIRYSNVSYLSQKTICDIYRYSLRK